MYVCQSTRLSVCGRGRWLNHPQAQYDLTIQCCRVFPNKFFFFCINQLIARILQTFPDYPESCNIISFRVAVDIQRPPLSQHPRISPEIWVSGPNIISPPGQNGGRFANDIFRCVFVNEQFCILTKISLKFVLKGPIDNNPLSEPKLIRFNDAWMRH